MRRSLRILVVIAALVAASCGTLAEVQDRDTLYFGTVRPGGVVTEAEWRAFVDEVITPRFEGFTEWNAEGYWKSQREASHVVEILHPHRPGDDAKLLAIISEYKKRFAQETVLLVHGRATVQFP